MPSPHLLPPLSRRLARVLWPWRRWLLGGALALALLPFVALAWFNQPFWDDFGHAAQARSYGLVGAQRYLYENWTGRYFSSVLLTAANPLTYGWVPGLRLVPVLALASTGLVLAAAVRALAGPGWRPALAVGAGLLLALLYTLPSPYSAFYWFASLVIYQVGALLLGVLLLASWQARRAGGPWAQAAWYALAGSCAVALAGTNELTLLLTGWLLACLATLAYRRAGWVGARGWLGMLVVLALGGAVLLAAPGNAVRLAQDAPLVPPAWWRVLVRAGSQTLLFLTEPRQLTALLVLPVLLAPLGYRARRQYITGLRLPLRLGLGIVLGGVVLAMLLLSRVAWGYPATRVLNLLWTWLLFGWLVVLWLALPPGGPARPGPLLRRLRRPLLLYVTLLALGGAERAAWRELLENAPAWQRQQQARQALARAARYSGQQQLTVPPVAGIRPYGILILGETLTPAANARPNQDMAAYYSLDSVRLSQPGLPLGNVQVQ